MLPFLRRLKSYLNIGSCRALSPEEREKQFRLRYRCFRSVLTANSAALSAMADLEQALISGQTYSMAMVRAKATVVLVNVYKMVHNLIEMADGKYRGLEEVFDRIGKEVESFIEQMPEVQKGPLVLDLSDIDVTMADQVGEKMAALGEVSRLPRVTTPSGFVMTAAASRYLISANNLMPEINRLKQLLDSEDMEKLYETSAAIQQLISNCSLPGDLDEALLDAYHRLEGKTRPGITVAMRSSALGEDLAGASFAGQYHTELSVDREFLGRTYKEIVASKYTSRAIVYRLKRGFRHNDIEMCVGCLAMIDARVSGVTYTREPGDPGSPCMVINCVSGLAQKVVDGTARPLRFLVRRGEPHEICLDGPDNASVRERTSGSFPEDLLTAAQVQNLARTALRLESHFGSPQDIEWSIDGEGDIVVLQTRTMAFAVQPSAVQRPLGPEDADVLFRGSVTASAGVACGPVCVVNSAVDILRFPRGAVLVVEHPLPEWAPLLARASALVATTGSEAGHLATVCREFGIPALFGVPVAVRNLAEETVVTVDSGRHRVYAGRREDLLKEASSVPDLMAGSPVQTVLKQILACISPLHLTDPSSPYFKPSGCETLHDITRFCHEKSVSAMFSFGSRYGVDARAAKRLMGEVLLDWWVINVGDGFRPGTDIASKVVGIGDIVSIPMLAIWDGIHAFPWAGPPTVDVKGMGSILFQSMMQPGLDPAVPNRMAGKNYFLISKNFCNLSVHLGYHFAMIESYLSELETESYVSFTFKGGAADDRRRAARIGLLSDILTRYDFRVELKGDAMTARIERKSFDFIRRRLMILGYLILHSRQIDMVMNNRDRANGYLEKFLTETSTFV